jgi:pyridoxine 5-phosphate synthase
VERLKRYGVRVSLFADCVPSEIPAFSSTGADRVELYTGPFAWAWGTPQQDAATAALWESAAAARAAGLGVNAGHDLDRHNLAGIAGMPGLDEVSIGHAQISRALQIGTPGAVRELLEALGWPISQG